MVEATGSTAVGDICVPLTRNGGTVLIYGVTRAEDIVQFHPFDVFRREITIKGSFAEITSFAAAIAALRGGRAKTDGIITHRFSPGRLRQGARHPHWGCDSAQSSHSSLTTSSPPGRRRDRRAGRTKEYSCCLST